MPWVIADQVPWQIVGPTAGYAAFLTLAWIVVRNVQNGEWIPKKTHDRELAQAQAQLDRAEHDANEWRTEGRLKDAQIAEKDRQLSHMGEVGRTVDAIMTALQQAASGNGNGNRKGGGGT